RATVAHVRRHHSDQDLSDQLRESAGGLATHSAEYWSGAAHLVLVEVDLYGSCTGVAHVVCRASMRQAGQLVLARRTIQGATLFDLVGAGEGDTQEGPCYICGNRRANAHWLQARFRLRFFPDNQVRSGESRGVNVFEFGGEGSLASTQSTFPPAVFLEGPGESLRYLTSYTQAAPASEPAPRAGAMGLSKLELKRAADAPLAVGCPRARLHACPADPAIRRRLGAAAAPQRTSSRRHGSELMPVRTG